MLSRKEVASLSLVKLKNPEAEGKGEEEREEEDVEEKEEGGKNAGLHYITSGTIIEF